LVDGVTSSECFILTLCQFSEILPAEFVRWNDKDLKKQSAAAANDLEFFQLCFLTLSRKKDLFDFWRGVFSRFCPLY